MNAKFTEFKKTEKLEELFETSLKEPVVFFKHSITCPISTNVFGEVANLDSAIWVVVVQEARNVSSEIANKTGVRHESPQAIIVKDGKAIYAASHYDISVSEMENILAKERIVS